MRNLPKYVILRKGRKGQPMLYFWRRPGGQVRLHGELGTPEFDREYAAALAAYDEREASYTPPAKPITRPSAGTLRWLCARYFASADFGRLDPRTRRVRRQIIEHCLREPITPGAEDVFGDVPLDRVTAKAIKVLRDRKPEHPEAANGRVKAFRQVFTWALEEEASDLLTFNPARDVKYRTAGGQGFHHWTTEEVEQFEERHPVGTKARLALALMLYTGQRRSDIIRFGRQHVRDGWLRFTQFKGRNHNPTTLEIPIVDALRDIIAASPTGDLTFLVTEFRKPFTSNGFGNRMRKWCDEAGLAECSSHGLRKASAARLAEVGCTAHEIMAITGHKTLKEVERYTKGVRQKTLARAAMVKFETRNRP